MKKGLKYITMALSLALGATACGESGGNGADGQNGANGKNGQNGQSGHNGLDNNVNGVDLAKLHIIGATAIDAEGSEEDDTIVVDFAADVTNAAAELDSSKLTFSYAKRKGSKLSVKTDSKNPEFKGLPVAALDENSVDGNAPYNTWAFLQITPGIHFDNSNHYFTTADKLAKIINEAIGIPDAVSVSFNDHDVQGDYISIQDPDNTLEGYKGNSSQIRIRFNKIVPLTRFDEEGNDVGIVITIPAFTITDYAGNGNEEFKFRFMNNKAPAEQVEPKAIAFDPLNNIVNYSTYNENCQLEKSGFILSFETPMNNESTELAIKRNLEQHPLLNLPKSEPIEVTVTAVDDLNFLVEPKQNINLWALEGDSAPTVSSDYDKFITCALDLTIPQYQLTTEYGIDNASGPITFHITDISHPELQYQNSYLDDYNNVKPFNDGYQFPYEWNINTEKDVDTVLIKLAYTSSNSAKVRALDGSNPYLEKDDTILVSFTENIKNIYNTSTGDKLADIIRDRLLGNLEKNSGSDNWSRITESERQALSFNFTNDNTYSFTIPDGYRLRTAETYIFNESRLENDTVIDINDGSNNVSIKQKEGRQLVAHSPNWLVAPSVLSFAQLAQLPEGTSKLFDKTSLKDNKVYDLPEDQADQELATAFVGLEMDRAVDYLNLTMTSGNITSLKNFEDKPELENGTISGNSSYKDSIVVFFNKKMNETITKHHLAWVIGHGALENAKRYTQDPNDEDHPANPVDSFDIDSSKIIDSYDPSNRVHRFIIKLGANQYIKATGSGNIIFDMDAIPAGKTYEKEIAMDMVRLPINQNSKLVIPVKIFDPAVAPVLESVVGYHTEGSRHCGNQMAEEKDTIVFTFNHMLRHDRKDKISDEERTSDIYIRRQIFKQVSKLLIEGIRNDVAENQRSILDESLTKTEYDDAVAEFFMTITSNQLEGNGSMDWFRNKVVYTVTIANDISSPYNPESTFYWNTNRPRWHFDVSQPIEFSFDPDTVITSFGVKAESKEAVTAIMQPFDKLQLNLSVINNVVENDGKFVAHDSFQVSFNCLMDDFYTLKAIQKGFDELVGDGIVRTSSIKDYAKDSKNNVISGSNSRGYQVEVLPGREFSTNDGMILNIQDVATWNGSNDAKDYTMIKDTFKAGISDAEIPDKIFRFVPGSNQGYTAQYKADTAAMAGIWYLNGVSAGLGRTNSEIPVIFSK